METTPLLSLQISVNYPGKAGVIRNLCLDIQKAEVLGLVGQSGCGKSTLALAILRLLYMKRGRAEGSIRLNGRDLMSLKESEMRSLRGKEIALVLQSPLSAFNPALRIGSQLEEAWRIHKKTSREECAKAIREMLTDVSLPTDKLFLQKFPAELSVGQAQRALIGMAILHRPALLIADEPTSALDIITQAEILKLFSTLSKKFGIGILYISHDLLSVATISHRVAVMDKGEIVECRQTSQIFRDPEHPYTRRLIASLPVTPQFETLV